MELMFFLLAAGLIFIAAEIFVPGGILGLIGSVLLIISAVMCFKEFGARIGIYYTSGLIICVPIVTILLMQAAPRLPIGKRLFLNTSYKGVRVEIESIKDLIGKSGTVYSVLRPTGRVEIDGKRFEATSEGSYIAQGQPVEVIRVEGNNLIVRQKKS